MRSSRRRFLHLGGISSVAALSGCTSFGGPQGYAAVVVENNHDSTHVISMAVSSQPDENAGYTEYFSEMIYLQAGERERFDEALTFTDYVPRLLAMAVTDSETTATTNFDLRRELEELRVEITDAGELQMTTAGDT